MMYEVFTVLSGIALLVMAFIPGVTSKYRLGLVVGAIACFAYVYYVSQQTSGTYYFSVGIFIVPVFAIIAVVYQLMSRRDPNAAVSASELAERVKRNAEARSSRQSHDDAGADDR
jgi:hypothetical protein